MITQYSFEDPENNASSAKDLPCAIIKNYSMSRLLMVGLCYSTGLHLHPLGPWAEILEDQQDIGKLLGARRPSIGRRFLKGWAMLLGIALFVKREESRESTY